MTSISVVTPCLNATAHIEQTLASVLDGSDRPDEYVVVDGGSTDGTAELIAARAADLTWSVSEPDDGQYAAVQKGFERTTGDVMAWLNGGDLYMHWTISVVRELFDTFPRLEWLTTARPMFADERGRIVACEFGGGFAADSFRRGLYLPGGDWFAPIGMQQESTFWRRTLWERAGSRVDTTLHYAGDFELWLRFFDHAEVVALDAPLGARRTHAGQKTEDLDAYVAEARTLLPREPGGRDLARRVVHYGIGRRPLRRLPGVAGKPLAAAGVLQRVPTIAWRDGWVELDDYAV